MSYSIAQTKRPSRITVLFLIAYAKTLSTISNGNFEHSPPFVAAYNDFTALPRRGCLSLPM